MRRAATAGLLIAWCLLAIGDSAAEGQSSHFALTCVSLGFLTLLAVALSGRELVVPGPVLVALPTTVALVAAIHHPANRYIAMSSFDIHAVQAFVIIGSLVALATLTLRGTMAHIAVVSIAAIVVMAGIVTVLREPHPGIDVWVFLQQSSSGLVHGHDMYRDRWAGSPGLQDVYPYLPITTVLLSPFKLLLGDVRYGLITASVIAMVFIRRSAPTAPPALACLLVLAPHWIFLTDQSWTEPLLVAAMAGCVLAIKSDRPWLAIIALAVALSCKQHIALLLPLFVMWPAFGIRRTITSAALAAIAVLPWFIAGPAQMWHDAVHANLSLPIEDRSLSLPSLLLRHGVHVGFWLLLAMVVASYAVAYWRLPRTPSGLAMGCALVMWALDLANKDSFFNHYWLPLGLLVIAAAVAAPEDYAAPSARGRIGASRPVEV